MALVYAPFVHVQYSGVATYFMVKGSIRSADDPNSSIFFLPRLRERVAAERKATQFSDVGAGGSLVPRRSLSSTRPGLVPVSPSDPRLVCRGGWIISTPVSSSSCPTASTSRTCNHIPIHLAGASARGARQLKETSANEENHALGGSFAPLAVDVQSEALSVEPERALEVGGTHQHPTGEIFPDYVTLSK